MEVYNKRAKKLIQQFSFEKSTFVILDKGRRADEVSVILVENNRYEGFGYFDKTESISTPEEMKGMVSRKNYYPDADYLIRHFLKKGSRKVIDLC